MATAERIGSPYTARPSSEDPAPPDRRFDRAKTGDVTELRDERHGLRPAALARKAPLRRRLALLLLRRPASPPISPKLTLVVLACLPAVPGSSTSSAGSSTSARPSCRTMSPGSSSAASRVTSSGSASSSRSRRRRGRPSASTTLAPGTSRASSALPASRPRSTRSSSGSSTPAPARGRPPLRLAPGPGRALTLAQPATFHASAQPPDLARTHGAGLLAEPHPARRRRPQADRRHRSSPGPGLHGTARPGAMLALKGAVEARGLTYSDPAPPPNPPPCRGRGFTRPAAGARRCFLLGSGGRLRRRRRPHPRGEVDAPHAPRAPRPTAARQLRRAGPDPLRLRFGAPSRSSRRTRSSSRRRSRRT